MSTAARPGTTGATRTCPHCKATILDSASVCPGCRGHLRFDSAIVQRAVPNVMPLNIEATLRQPSDGPTWEYSVVLSIRDGRGEEVTRQVVGVGALKPNDERTISVAVEVFERIGPNPTGNGKSRH